MDQPLPACARRASNLEEERFCNARHFALELGTLAAVAEERSAVLERDGDNPGCWVDRGYVCKLHGCQPLFNAFSYVECRVTVASASDGTPRQLDEEPPRRSSMRGLATTRRECLRSHRITDALANLHAMATATTSAATPLLTVAEVAGALRVSGETIRRRVADGTIRGVVLGRVIRIPRGELERLLDDTAHVVRSAVA